MYKCISVQVYNAGGSWNYHFYCFSAGKAVAKALAWAVAIPAQRFRISSHFEAKERLAQDNF